MFRKIAALAIFLSLGACSTAGMVEAVSDSGRYDMVVGGGQGPAGPAQSGIILNDKVRNEQYAGVAAGPRNEEIVLGGLQGPLTAAVSGFSAYRTAGNCGDCGGSQFILAPQAVAGAVSENTNTLDGTATINDGGQGGRPPKH